MTAFAATARVLFVIAAAPGRLLIGWINRRKADNGVAPLGGFLRGSVHAFVWFCAFIALVMVNGPAPAPTRSTASVAPPTVTSAPVTRAPAATSAPVTSAPVTPEPVEDDDVYVPLPDGDDHNMRDGALTGGYCARKWWC